MSSAYQVVPRTDREQVAQWYTLDGQRQAAAFLDAHPTLTPMLLEAYPVLVRHFPQGKMALRVTHDPEGWDWSELVAAINPGCEPSEAFQRYEAFKQEWWFATKRQNLGSFFFLVDYTDAV